MSVRGRIRTGISSPLGVGLKAVLDLLLPHQCLKCRIIVGERSALCAACWGEITFIAPPVCTCCGYPFELDFDPGGDPGGVPLRSPIPPSGVGFQAWRQNPRCPRLRCVAGPRGGAPGGRGRSGGLHRWRLFRRRYNQAALLAQAFGAATGLPCVPDLLNRVRATPSQGRLSRARRRDNVRGAFAIAPARAEVIKGLRVLLVDDVLTTGATVNAATRCLLSAGAAAVDVLTLARVVRPVP